MIRKTPLKAQNDYLSYKFGGHDAFGPAWVCLCK